MPLQLAQSDSLLIGRLREKGVLQDVMDHRLPLKDGAIVVMCGDADQASDIWDYSGKLQARYRSSSPRIHLLAQNGGALRLAENSPANRAGSTVDADLLHDIGAASDMKNIRTVVLLAHAPCGQAQACGIGLKQTLDLLRSAKARVKQALPSICVVSFFHVDRGEDPRVAIKVKRRRCTYYVSSDNFVRCFAHA